MSSKPSVVRLAGSTAGIFARVGVISAGSGDESTEEKTPAKATKYVHFGILRLKIEF